MKDTEWGRKYIFMNYVSCNGSPQQIPLQFANGKLPRSCCRAFWTQTIFKWGNSIAKLHIKVFWSVLYCYQFPELLILLFDLCWHDRMNFDHSFWPFLVELRREISEWSRDDHHQLFAPQLTHFDAKTEHSSSPALTGPWRGGGAGDCPPP